MIEIKTPQEVEEMKPAARLVAKTLKELRESVKPGTNLLEIDEYVHKVVKDTPNCSSPYVDYAPDFGTGPFAHWICTSVNDAVLHGVPHDYNLKEGDLLSLDLALTVNGWVGDSALSFIVGGKGRPADEKVIRATEEALAAGIEQARVGNHLGDISAAVGEVAHKMGYSVNTVFGGHGIGHEMHCEPYVPNDGRAHRGFKLRPGLVICIEPWLMEGTDEIYQDPDDGWTIRSADGSRGAHSEHEIAITSSGPVILTAR
ncbi:MAG: type I methionyl aminopeptidase [Aeriscardovia sp.]|nr:type I methionyl aminopeptidase [Aeriscardovia sp.]